MFTTIHGLVSDTKFKIDKLHQIVDVLLMDYRASCEIINTDSDRRQVHIDQLQELNNTIGDIVDTHPVLRIDATWNDALSTIKTIAEKTTHES
jgi:hypothetical protein